MTTAERVPAMDIQTGPVCFRHIDVVVAAGETLTKQFGRFSMLQQVGKPNTISGQIISREVIRTAVSM